MRRFSLLQRFAAVSLVLVVLLGLLMAQLLSSMISTRALDAAADATALSASVAIQPLLAPEDLVRELPAGKVAALDEAVSRFSGSVRDRPDQDLAQRRRPALRRRPPHPAAEGRD